MGFLCLFCCSQQHLDGPQAVAAVDKLLMDEDKEHHILDILTDVTAPTLNYLMLHLTDLALLLGMHKRNRIAAAQPTGETGDTGKTGDIGEAGETGETGYQNPAPTLEVVAKQRFADLEPASRARLAEVLFRSDRTNKVPAARLWNSLSTAEKLTSFLTADERAFCEAQASELGDTGPPYGLGEAGQKVPLFGWARMFASKCKDYVEGPEGAQNSGPGSVAVMLATSSEEEEESDEEVQSVEEQESRGSEESEICTDTVVSCEHGKDAGEKELNPEERPDSQDDAEAAAGDAENVPRVSV